MLEVLLALVLLAISAAAWMGLMQQGITTLHTMREREAAVAKASAELNRMALWQAADLANHTGPRRVGALIVQVASVGESLYDVVVTDTTGRVRILATTFYRRGSSAPSP